MAPLAERSLEDAADRFEAACDGRIIYIGLEWKATLIGAVKEIETATINHQSSANDFTSFSISQSSTAGYRYSVEPEEYFLSKS